MKGPEKHKTLDSLILITGTRYLVPVLLLFSLFLFTRGHNEPGGGFVAGLVASAAFALYAIAFGVARTREALHINTIRLIGIGLLLAFLSGLLPLFGQKPFLTAVWSDITLPVIGRLNTVLTFDTGVYLVVVGVTLTIIFAMAEADIEEDEEEA